MLNITEAAGEYLCRVLDEANVATETAVRLVVEANGLTAALDTERPGDASIGRDGRKVLLLDAQASQVLAERTLEVQATDDGPRLGISRVTGRIEPARLAGDGLRNSVAKDA